MGGGSMVSANEGAWREVGRVRRGSPGLREEWGGVNWGSHGEPALADASGLESSVLSCVLRLCSTTWIIVPCTQTTASAPETLNAAGVRALVKLRPLLGLPQEL